MAIAVVLEDDAGNELGSVGDHTGLLARIAAWPPEDRARLRLLHDVDPYGDAVFEAAQARDLLLDVGALLAVASDDEEEAFLGAFAGLGRRLRDEPRRYVRLYGD